MNPFNHVLRFVNEKEINEEIKFLPKKITDAVKNGNLELIKTFSINQLNGISNVYMASGRPLIFDALNSYNSYQVLQLMIDLGTNINCFDSGFPNRSLLLQAVKTGSFEQIKILVEFGADLNFKGNWDDGDIPQTIIGTALFYKRFEVVKYLESKGGKYFKDEKKIIIDFQENQFN